MNRLESTKGNRKKIKPRRNKEIKGLKGISYRPKRSLSAPKSFRPKKQVRRD